jgi:hypothetical protein
MANDRDTERKLIGDKVYLTGISNPISRIIRDSVYRTDGEFFLVIKDTETCRLVLDSNTTNHIRIKALTKVLISPLIGKIDEEYDEIFIDKGACVEFLQIEGAWYIVSSDGLKLN